MVAVRDLAWSATTTQRPSATSTTQTLTKETTVYTCHLANSKKKKCLHKHNCTPLGWNTLVLWDRQLTQPSIGLFSPQMLICLRKCISNYKTKQSSQFQSDQSSNCITIDVWKIQWIVLLSYCFVCISSSWVFWHVIFYEKVCLKICSSVWMKTSH